MVLEYTMGSMLRRTIGQAPWDYSAARRHFRGLVRPDYFPLWGAVGIGMERVHDRLTGR
jgi:Putative ABC-transporter type IV